LGQGDNNPPQMRLRLSPKECGELGPTGGLDAEERVSHLWSIAGQNEKESPVHRRACGTTIRVRKLS